jgi:hypothetical protein
MPAEYKLQLRLANKKGDDRMAVDGIQVVPRVGEIIIVGPPNNIYARVIRVEHTFVFDALSNTDVVKVYLSDIKK